MTTAHELWACVNRLGKGRGEVVGNRRLEFRFDGDRLLRPAETAETGAPAGAKMQQQLAAQVASPPPPNPAPVPPPASESRSEAPPKQVALAMDRLSQAARLIADVRLGADRILEALFVAAQPHQSTKPIQSFNKEDASMRQHLQDLRAIGT